MAVSLVSSASGNAAANASLTFTGYTPALNDVVVMFPSTTVVSALAAIPSGWVNPLGGVVSVDSDSHSLACVYHLVTSAEVTAVTTTYTATGLYASTLAGYNHGAVLRGVDTTTVVDAIATALDSGNAITPHVVPGLLGSDLLTGSLVLSSVAKDLTGGYGTAPTGWTLVQNTDISQAKALLSLNTAATYNTDVAATTITPASGDEYASITMAFRLSGATPPVSSGAEKFFLMF